MVELVAREVVDHGVVEVVGGLDELDALVVDPRRHEEVAVERIAELVEVVVLLSAVRRRGHPARRAVRSRAASAAASFAASTAAAGAAIVPVIIAPVGRLLGA